MTAAPRRAPLVLVPQYFGSTVFDRRTSRYLPFDRESTELLLRTRAEPFGALIDAAPDAARRASLERFFASFYARGFFRPDLTFAGHALEIAPPAEHLVGPLALHLEVVAACNLTCTHCFAGELPRREPPLTLAELDALFATLARVGTFRLGLTGGEPLLRRDLFEVIDLAVAHGLHPCVTTNGLLVTEAIAREFGKRDLVWLNVSLEGATAATNDAVRGAGTYARVREKLAALGRHARFTLAFTVMRSNLHEVRACAALAAEVGAHAAVFRPLYPVGVAREHLELMPTFAEYAAAVDELAALGVEQVAAGAGEGFDLRGLDPFGPATRAEAQSVVHQNHGCGAGNIVCSVSLAGDVNPCSFLGSGFVADNVRRRPFEEIWHASQVFRSIRGLPGDGAGTATFGGGCRARALVLGGSANAPDPWLAAHEAQAASGARAAEAGAGAGASGPCATQHPLVVLEPRRRRPGGAA